jgi:DNA invertase Pin-like site-specific DNA recombinase
MSIENQRKILTKYAEESGLIPFEFVFDDGYSGADWDRPAFNQILEDVEAGRVKSIVTKDRSRLGRDRLKLGFLTEILFPQHDVRYIAIHDNTDSERDDDIAPLIDLFNEWFVRNTSKKIRAVKQAQGKAGERLAVIPPYGYRKDPDNPKQLVIDDESAAVVRRIFRLSVDGHGPAQIARLLGGERILNPSAYKAEHGIVKKPRQCKDPYFWNTTTVHKILDAPEYLGTTVNFKTYSKSYKDNRPRLNPPEKQMVFEGTHTAIIDAETWDIVRKMREHKRRSPRYGENGLFSGAVYCSDCGSKLYFHTRMIWNKDKTQSRLEGSYSCSEYRKDVQYLAQGRKCTCHFIRETVLEQVVLDDLRELLAFVTRNEKKFVRLVMDKSQQEQKQETAARKKALAKQKQRIEEIDALIERLYVDNGNGKVSNERYEKMSAKFEAEQAALIQAHDALEAEIAGHEEAAGSIDKFLDTVRRYTTEIEKLTPAIVHEFIDRIIIHEPEQARGNRRQEVEIIYHKIGKIDLESLIAESA